MTTYSKEQLRVIKTTAARAEVLACAGSGKTATLCARIDWLVERGTAPEQILVLSFSNAAVDVLSCRLEGRIAAQTFHAFTQHLARTHYGRLGFQRPPTLLAPTDQLVHVRSAIAGSRNERVAIRTKAGVNLSTNVERKRLATFFTRIQGDGKLARQLASDSNSEFYQYLPVLGHLRRIHRRYEVLKREANVIDYGDMLRFGRAALEQGVGLPYRYLFVDECQDMNRAQTELLGVLATVIPHVMTFGDPLQAVFGFSGGRFRPLSSLMDEVHIFQLTHSFRLSQRTADFATAVGKPLSEQALIIHGRALGRKPLLVHAMTTHQQTSTAVNIIRGIERASSSAATVAVLARTKAQLREIEVALLAANFNAQPLHRQHVRQHMDALCRILDLMEQCRMQTAGALGLVGRPLERFMLHAADLAGARIDDKVVAACRRNLLRLLLSPTLQGRYIGARRIYEKLLRAAGLITADIRADLGRWESLCNRFADSSELQHYVHSVLSLPPVVLATIHASKGREWDHVLLLGLTDGSLPYYRALENDAEDEERRLFYVAVSRPRVRLYMFHAPYHYARSGTAYIEPSRFMVSKLMKSVAVPRRR